MMYLHKKLAAVWLAILSLFSLSSCFEGYFDGEVVTDSLHLDGEYLIPIGTGSITFLDLVSAVDSLVEVDASGPVVVFSISDTLVAEPPTEFIPLLDQSFSSTLVINDTGTPITVVGPPVEFTVDVNEMFTWTVDGIETLTEAQLRAGTLTLAVEGNPGVTYTLNAGSANVENAQGTALSLTLGPVGANDTFESTSRDLQGATVFLDVNGSTSEITLTGQLDVTLQNGTLAPGASVQLRLDLAGLEYELLRGDFGQQQMDFNTTVPFSDVFSAVDAGQVFFADPNIELSFFNDYGVEAQVDFTQFSALNENTGATISFTGPQIDQGIRVAPAANPGEQATSFQRIDQTGSNIQDVVNILPTNFTIGATGLANPGAGPYSNFLTANAELLGAYSINFPVDFALTGIEATDTIELEAGIDDVGDYIEEGAIIFSVRNGLPVNLGLRGVLLDTLGQAIGEVFQDEVQVLTAAPTDAEGNVLADQVETERVVARLNADVLPSLPSLGSVVLFLELTAGGPGDTNPVKIGPEAALDLTLSLYADVEYYPTNSQP